MAALFLSAPQMIQAQGLIADCDPASTDLGPGGEGCGVNDARDTIYKIISWLAGILMVLAAIFIALGGFTILTAAGSVDRVTKGRKMITIAITGIIITLAAGLIVRLIIYVVVGPENVSDLPIEGLTDPVGEIK